MYLFTFIVFKSNYPANPPLPATVVQRSEPFVAGFLYGTFYVKQKRPEVIAIIVRNATLR